MSEPLFYVDALAGVGELAAVEGDEGFHAATVRRIRPGEIVILGDGAGGLARCEVTDTDKRGLRALVHERWTDARPTPAVTVAQAIPKAERSELAIELATEAGADEFLAWHAARCVARWEGPRADKGLRRWRAVARSAARQSRRAYVPDVEGVVATATLVDRIRRAVEGGAVVLVLHESATRPLTDLALAQADSLMLVVGPEGGITDEEIAAFTAAGAVAIRLGPSVLRTSSAAAVALGALGVLTPRWR